MRASPADVARAVHRIEVVAGAADDLGASAVASEARALAVRAREGRLFVACLGQFKRGKSSLINALVGEPILPTGVLPVTAIVTILRHGATMSARVHDDRGGMTAIAVSDLPAYVTEAGNPDNVKRIAAVEVFHPSPLLAGGLCLVDTPGLGSSSALATEVTERFVPQIDAVLAVLGADPPVTRDELALLEQASVETREFVFVINKADKLSDAELVDVQVFTSRLLAERLGHPGARVFIVSAAERLAGERTRDWDRLEAALVALGAEGRTAALGAHVERAADRLERQVRYALDEAEAALDAPAAVMAQRIADLRRHVDEATRAAADVSLLLAAEQGAIIRRIREDAEAALAGAREAAIRELRAAITTASDAGTARLRQVAFTAAADAARHAVEPQLVALEHLAAEAYRQASARFVQVANERLAPFARTLPALAAMPPIELPAALAGRRRFYFTDLLSLTAARPWQFALEHLGSHRSRQERVLARATGYLDRLIDTNMSRAIHDVDDRLDQSRRALDVEIRARLAEVVPAAARALARADQVRADGERAVAAERARLAGIRQRLARDDDEAPLTAAPVAEARS
jgi:hypothetical protein